MTIDALIDEIESMDGVSLPKQTCPLIDTVLKLIQEAQGDLRYAVKGHAPWHYRRDENREEELADACESAASTLDDVKDLMEQIRGANDELRNVAEVTIRLRDGVM